MKVVLSLIYLLSLFSLNGAETKKDVFILVYGVYKPGIDVTFKKSIFDSGVICYPITSKAGAYSEEAIKLAFQNYILAEDDSGTVSDLKIQFFADQKEAVNIYQALMNNRKEPIKKVSFSRAHIDKVMNKMKLDSEKKAEDVSTVKKVDTQKAIDDIYD
ncbi:MAG: hypothetical protein NE328_10330 [Lentisphaeraceae bacterium]|nr:hypothetical protein [Lentisphaeraceae bacterium]